MKSLRLRLGTLWCKSMHPAPMWPMNGHYQCPTCLRSYPVPWEHPRESAAIADQPMTRAVIHAPRTSAASMAAASR